METARKNCAADPSTGLTGVAGCAQGDRAMSSLAESSVLIDRALVTLCSELPESLGLYNTGKDQLSIAAMRGVPMLDRLAFESRKHFIIRDWMRSYVPGEDQALTAEISFDSLRETLKGERKERQRLEREQEAARGGASPTAANGKSKKKKKQDKQKEKSVPEKPKKKKKDTNRSSSAERSRNGKAKAKGKSKQKPRVRSTRQHPGDSDDEAEFVVSDGDISMGSNSSSSEDSSSSSESESSEEETKESEQREKSRSSRGKKKKKKVKSNLPPVEAVLSSDEDEEPNEMFDEGDPDVYEVETILDKRPGQFGGEPEYLIKWVGYEETTWEPAANVSKDLVDEFEGQPVRENEYAVEEIRDRRSKRDPETRLKTHEYLVKWVGYDEQTWEPAENLPHNLRRKFDSKYEARKRRRR